MRTLVVPLLAYSLSGSIVAAGVVSTVTQVVSLVFAVPGGVIVDRFDRRRLMGVYALVGVGCWGGLGVLLMTGTASFTLLVILVVLAAVNGGLLGHVTDAALRSIVPTDKFPSAMAANQGRDAALELGASPAGGALYAVRMWVPTVVMAAGYLLLFATSRFIRADLTPRRTQRESFLRELPSGFVWVWHRRDKRIILAMLLLVNFGVTGLLYVVQISMIAREVSPALIGLLDQ